MANNPGTDVASADRQVEVMEVAGAVEVARVVEVVEAVGVVEVAGVVEVVGVVEPIGHSIRALRTIGALLVGFLAIGVAGVALGATMDAFDHRGANRATLIGVGLALAVTAAGLSWLAWRLGLYGVPRSRRPEPHSFPMEPLVPPPHAFEARQPA